MAAARREPLTRERILRAALAIADREGLDAVSMRGVGAALGVEAMSLYNHVPNKAALLDGLHERILEEMDRPRSARTWTAYARHQARALRRVLRAHPNAVVLFATRPATTPAALVRLEQYLAVLAADGFKPLDALEVVQCVSAFVVGHTLRTVAPSSAAPAYATLDPERFRHVRRAAASLDRYDAEKEFERGLDALLRGLADAAS
jgi:TetR/AcrR family transcriptional regulator, tetracycline repressor protein